MENPNHCDVETIADMIIDVVCQDDLAPLLMRQLALSVLAGQIPDIGEDRREEVAAELRERASKLLN